MNVLDMLSRGSDIPERPAAPSNPVNHLDSFQGIANALLSARRKIPPASNMSAELIDKIEIEVRVGLVINGLRRSFGQGILDQSLVIEEQVRSQRGLRFRSGIDEPIVEIVKAVFGKGVRQPEQRLRVNDLGNRWSVDHHGRVISCESKKKLATVDVACIGHQYDLRIDLASETPQQVESPSMYEVYSQERIKRRITFNPEICADVWKVDLTFVETKAGSSIGSIGATCKNGVELEFEMKEACRTRWLSETDDKKIVEMTAGIASRLHAAFNLCIGSSIEDHQEGAPSTEPYILSGAGESQIIELNNHLKSVSSCPPVTNAKRYKSMEFLGTMPVNLSRRSFLTVQTSDYFVTEKSDGVRHLLYVIGNPSSPSDPPTAIIMDRALSTTKLAGGEAIGAALKVGTILDGELVYNLTMKTKVFMVFDVLALDGEPYIEKPFRERLKCINTTLAVRFSSIPTASAHSNSASPTAPTMLVAKAFVEKKQLTSLIGSVRGHGGASSRVFYNSAYRHHKTDGFIFQPANTTYELRTDYSLLKWKWADLRSIDLQVVFRDPGAETTIHSALNPLKLLCSGPEGTQIDCFRQNVSSASAKGMKGQGGSSNSMHDLIENTSNMVGVCDMYRLRADIEDFNREKNVPSSTPRVAEMCFTPANGVWTYHHLRADKMYPNSIETSLAVIMEQAESITVEELEYTLIARNEAENDFMEQLNKMKDKALDFQRQRVHPPRR